MRPEMNVEATERAGWKADVMVERGLEQLVGNVIKERAGQKDLNQHYAE